MRLPGVRSIDPASEEIDSYEMVLLMFNLVVAIIIFMVIILAFMVQLNLSNIQVSRRMNDILVMRVNGFSMPQVLSYLTLETVITTGAGIILGVALGVPFARFMVVKVEVQQIMFVRTPFEYAWEVAAGLCALFSLMINSIAFRKIGKVSLTSIEKG
jgi:putative ABC transport system permease protein